MYHVLLAIDLKIMDKAFFGQWLRNQVEARREVYLTS